MLILMAAILTAVIVGLVWPEQYGGSYSEQQRNIWNEQMELTHTDMFMIKFPAHYHYQGDYPSIERRWEINSKFSEQLRNESAPEWNVIPPASPDLSKLPLEGMTFDELLHVAETQKNPDAYLTLLTSTYVSGHPTKLQLLLVKQWAVKAHELNRPGSGFLIRAIDQREATLPVSKDKKTAEHHLASISGYKEFGDLISAGDFTLYKALLTVWPGMHRTSISTNLEKTLERKAGQGDATAQRQLGEYGFLLLDSTIETIEQEENRPRHRWILWLSGKAEQWCPELITISKTMDTSPTRDHLNQYASWLKKAAEAGDLTAMDLWLTYGIETFKHYGRKDWNDILSYTDTLLEAGYKKDLSLFHYSITRSHAIINLSYSPKSLKLFASNCGDSQLERGNSQEFREKLRLNKWNENTTEDNLNLLDRAEQQNPGFLLPYWENRFSMIEKIKLAPVRQRYIDIIRKTANQGDVLFMTALADMIRAKLVEPEIPEERTLLLERAWSLCPKYNIRTDPLPLGEIIVEMLMEIYLIENPSPEHEQKAFELARQYSTYEDRLHHSACFYLFMMYQKGYGTPKNKELEKYYYQKTRWVTKESFKKFNCRVPE